MVTITLICFFLPTALAVIVRRLHERHVAKMREIERAAYEAARAEWRPFLEALARAMDGEGA